jgi:hypothetical protein
MSNNTSASTPSTGGGGRGGGGGGRRDEVMPTASTGGESVRFGLAPTYNGVFCLGGRDDPYAEVEEVRI